MQAAAASRCLRIIRHRSHINHTVQSFLKSNHSSAIIGPGNLSSKPRSWCTIRTRAPLLKVNAFLSDFPSKTPQNPVTTSILILLSVRYFSGCVLDWINVFIIYIRELMANRGFRQLGMLFTQQRQLLHQSKRKRRR